MRTIIALLLLGVLVAGCSAPTETGSSSDDAPTMREAMEEAGVVIDPDLRDFMLLEEKRATQEYMVAYTFTMNGPQGTIETQTTTYQSGADKLRTDTDMGDIQGRTYELGDRYVTCTRFGGSWTCEETDLASAEPTEWDDMDDSDIGVYDVDALETESTIERDGEETILGQTAECWRIVTDGFEGRECRNKKGVMLLTAGEQSGSTLEIRATAYRDTVSASDFEPPAAPMEAGSEAGQDQACRQGCVFMELSDAECDEICSLSADDFS